jgi:DNA ligase-1
VADALPDGTVIDGEVLPWKENLVVPFAQLQRRIGRKTLTHAILTQIPVIMMAYDLLEHRGLDMRSCPLDQRRTNLADLIEMFHAQVPSLAHRLCLSPVVEAPTSTEVAHARAASRDAQAEGLMLEHRESNYGVGRRRGSWWKWKTEPYTIDAVLIAAQRGSGKRASLYTDYMFGVWDKGALVAIAKAYSGLTGAEIDQVDAFIRRKMVEKFGPVRTVKPDLVFELAFERLNRSSRHKSGIAVRFPRILRWRTDKNADDADTIETVRALLPPEPLP